MPTRVISAGGVPTTVANMDDVDGEAYTLPAATTAAIGGVKKMAAQADSTATDALAWLPTSTRYWLRLVPLG